MYTYVYNTAGVYHKYDSMVFPSDALISRGFGERVMSGLKNLWPLGKKNEAPSKDNLEVPEYHIILQNCLIFYIDVIISTGQFSDSLHISRVVQGINHIFTCLLESQFTNQDGRRTIWLLNAGLKKQPLQEV